VCVHAVTGVVIHTENRLEMMTLGVGAEEVGVGVGAGVVIIAEAGAEVGAIAEVEVKAEAEAEAEAEAVVHELWEGASSGVIVVLAAEVYNEGFGY